MLAVEPPLHAAIKRLSELQGRPMAAICTDFLEAALPALTELVDLLERAAALPAEAQEAVLAAVGDVEASVRTITGDADRQLELLDAAVGAASKTRP